MYVPPAFREDDVAVLHAEMHAARLAHFVTATADGMIASPIPMFVDPADGPYGTLYGLLVVPGSARVRLQAESEGLDKVFLDAGAEWRNAGCSMCLGMNPDQLQPGERAASTSNRNFEGRQGKGGRTHLVSPIVAAATALRGTLSSPADL